MTFKAMKFKVENPSQSEAIQRELFKLGYKWFGERLQVVEEVEQPFLYAEPEGVIRYGDCADTFRFESNILTTLEQLYEYVKASAPKTPRTALEDCAGAITVGFETPATPHDLVAKAFNLVSGYDLSSDDVALILQLAKRSQ
jgi:hypothetical protein